MNNKLLNALMIDKVGLHENSYMNMEEINPEMPFNDRLNARLMDIVISRKFGHAHRHVDNPMQDPESHVGRTQSDPVVPYNSTHAWCGTKQA